jgi:TRAP transporter TAXI family solute receptor
MKINWILSTKVTIAVLLFVLLSSIAMAGCSTPQSTTETPKAEVKSIRWGTSSVGSTGYNLSAKMADIVGKYTKLEVNITPVGGTEATVRTITRGERDLGFGNTQGVYEGYNGVGSFAKEGKQPILLIAMTYDATMPFVAQPNIKSVSDFKGKTISYRRAPNPIFNAFGDLVLKAYGLDPDKDVKNIATVELSEIVDALKTGSMDAGLIPGSMPGAVIPQLMEAKQFNVIDVGKEKVQSITKDSPFLAARTIKAGTFKGQDYEVNTLGFVNVVFANSKLPDKAVYDITKAIYTHLDELATADPVAKTITLANACKDPVIPLHPGAIQFYKEAGVLK